MRRWLMSVLWPAFLLGCAMEMLVFSVVDPNDVHWAVETMDLSRMGIYTIAFFAFWLVGMGACALAVLLAVPADARGLAKPLPARARETPPLDAIEDDYFDTKP
ncbi:MAG: hypothetical protein QM766_05825 [Burkholderiaceae bacterium]